MKFSIPLDSLQAVRHLAGVRDIRPYLNGVSIDASASTIRIVATDGSAAAIALCALDSGDTGGEAFGVPSDTCDAILKASKIAGRTFVTFEKKDGRIEAVGLGILVNPLEGVFPDVRRVVPVETSGLPAQFDPANTARFSKAAKALGHRSGTLHVSQNGDSAAVVRVLGKENFLGVMMPFRFKGRGGVEIAFPSDTSAFR